MEISSLPVSTQSEVKAVLAYPWRRFIARGLDMSIYRVVWSAFQYLVLRLYLPGGFISSTFVSYIVLGLMMLMEPLFLSTWGSTPGKAVMGLVVRTTNGSKLSYSEALERTFGVFAVGFGYGIPFYDLYRQWKCYSACERGEPMDWDDGVDYCLKGTQFYRTISTIALGIAAIGMMLIVGLQAELPRFRGDLTPAKYAINVNEILSRQQSVASGYRLSETGQWVFDEGWRGIPLGRPPEHKIKVENGIVTGVSFEVTSTNKILFTSQQIYDMQKYIMVKAFLAAQREINWFTYWTKIDMKKLSMSKNNYSLEVAGVRITQVVEYRGYWDSGEWLFPTDGEEQYFHLLFSIEKSQ